MALDFISILNPQATNDKKKKKPKIDFTKLVSPVETPEAAPIVEEKPRPDFGLLDFAMPDVSKMTSTPSMILPGAKPREPQNIQAYIGSAPKPPFKQPVIDTSMTKKEAVNEALKAWREGTLPADLEKRKALAQENIPEISRNIRIGLGGTAASTVRGAEWLAPDKMKPKISDIAKNIETNIEILSEENPTFADSLVQGAASSALFFIPGIGISKGLQVLGMTGKWGLATGLTLSTSLESMAEAGGVYKTSLDRGLSEEEASTKASQTFWANMVVIGLTNKLGPFSDKIKNNLVRAFISAPFEGVQEGIQQVIQNFENDVPLMEGVNESALIGAIVGGPMGFAGGVKITPDVMRRMIEEKFDPLPPDPPSPLVSFTQQDTQLKEQWKQEAIDKAIVDFRQAKGIEPKKPLIDFKSMVGEKIIPTIKADKLISHEGAPDTKTVAEYVTKIQKGETIEPVKIIKEGDVYGIEDGKHRFEAYQQLGIQDIPFEDVSPTEAVKAKERLTLEVVETKVMPELKKEDITDNKLEELGFETTNLMWTEISKDDLAKIDPVVLTEIKNRFKYANTKKFPVIPEMENIPKELSARFKDLGSEARTMAAKNNFKLEKTATGYRVITPNDVFIDIKYTGRKEIERQIAGEKIQAGKRPIFSKRELKTLTENIPEFQKSPRLKVILKDGDKLLQFKTDKTMFSIKPEALGLIEKNLKVGDEITFDARTLKVKGEEIRVVKRKLSESKEGISSGSYYASKGDFAHINIPDHVTHIEMPELIKLTKSLMDGVVPFIKKYPSALGMFYADPTNPRIGLNPSVFENLEDQTVAVKVLSHEIGHLIDYLPDANIKKGNLLNRLESLVHIRAGIFGDEALIKQRKNLMNSISQLNRIEKTRKLTIDESARRDTKIEKFNEINEKLVFEKDMRDELKGLSQFWKPFDARINKNHTAYRYSSPELYADFISVLFNRPDLAKVKAPKFHKRFFDYMESKPAVKDNYFKLMDFLTGKREDILDTREADIRKSFQTATELEIQRMSEGIGKTAKERASKLANDLNRTLIEKNISLIEAVEEKIKAGEEITPDKDPSVLLEELDLVKNEISNVFDKIGIIDTGLSEMELTNNDFSTYLFFKRITGDRATKANPFGATKQSSEEGLNRMKEKLGKEKFSVLEQSAVKFNEIYKEEMQLGVDSGLYSQELFDELTTGDNIYATFRILDYVLSGSVTPNMIAQIGTFKDIGQTYQATISKMVAIRVASHKNNFKKVSGEFFLKNFSQDEAIKIDIPEIKKADILTAKIDPRTGGAPQIKINKAGDRLELISWREEGKVKGVYVDPEIARSFKYDTNLNNQLIRETVGFVNNEIFRKAYIDYSIRFIVRNPVRDLRQAWKAMSMADLQGTGQFKITFGEFVSGIKKAYPEARAFAKNVKTETVQQILDKKIMGVEEDYHYTEADLDESTAFSREMIKRGLRLGDIKKGKVSLNPFVHLGNFIIQVGKTNEAITKIMAYQVIEEQLNMRGATMDKRTAQFIRNNIGTPNWRKGGTATPNTNTLYMFSNVMLQGYKRTYHLATQPNTKSGYLWRTAGIAILPKMLMWMAAAGLLGDELEKLYSRVSSYQLRNYLVIPLGTHNGKTVKITLPFDYDERLITAILWTALDSIKAKSVNGADAWNLIFSEMPTLTNTINIPLTWTEYWRDIPPRDNWKGRNIFTDNEFKAGGFYSLKPMLKWTWNQVLSGVYKVEMRDSVRKQTWLEKVAKIPGINVFLSIDDYGLQENIMDLQRPLERDKARESIDKRSNIIDNLRDFYKSGDPESDINKYISAAMKKEFDGMAFTIAEENSFRKSFMTEVMKSYNNAYITSLIYSNTIDEQKVAIKEIKKGADKDDFYKIQALFLNSKLISFKTWDAAIAELKKEERESQ